MCLDLPIYQMTSVGRSCRSKGISTNISPSMRRAAYGRDALYIFTPDVMAALIDFGRTYDIEIVDDYLLFYGTQQLTLDSQQQLESLLGVIEIVSKEIHDQSHRYADERVGEPALDVID